MKTIAITLFSIILTLPTFAGIGFDDAPSSASKPAATTTQSKTSSETRTQSSGSTPPSNDFAGKGSTKPTVKADDKFSSNCERAAAYAASRKYRWNQNCYQPGDAELKRLESQHQSQCDAISQRTQSSIVYTNFKKAANCGQITQPLDSCFSWDTSASVAVCCDTCRQVCVQPSDVWKCGAIR